ncbi:endonuclease III [Bacillota bacterium LX-D]|nr:endonuclease III [Bacillota bacterium LX-D]
MNMEQIDKKKTQEILNLLARSYPNAKPALNFANSFQLLIATILSAQSTDNQVNKVTANLFTKYQTPADIAVLTPEELAKDIKGCGLYHTKSKNIIATCKILADKYGGKVPDRLEQLVELPGVGRKTANVVLSNAFGQDAIAVDTHVLRVANRLGLANSTDPFKTEMQLQQVIPQKKWSLAHHWLIYHGRKRCKARRPDCLGCELTKICPRKGLN